ncbi:unnamed protein product [Schistocephalus solidus]|uniref:Rab-GAP TBC domain-containing protein n=1 Tax=Schistocephalus solidus TaxID=70667 RepID=A0A183TIQ5_SCHSO|nr:unnamed protein product [Schistocephalus solidus]
MQEVLQAFALHNPDVGYCQGMNFIVGNASLFLDKETTFWLLVLFVECHFSPNYFNAGLIAAQADQSVMRELIQYFSPDLYRHLQNLEIDMSTLTLNWFMAVFVSAVPIEVSHARMQEPPPILSAINAAVQQAETLAAETLARAIGVEGREEVKCPSAPSKCGSQKRES